MEAYQFIFPSAYTCDYPVCVPKMISIVLVEPRNSGNVGAVARVMANFGFEKLVLVNPKCNHLSQTARNRAKWAQDVLQKAKVVKKLPEFDTLAATTAKIGTDYNIPRSPITPKQLSSICRGNAGLVFGRENTGLTNEEILSCDFVVSIPASKKYPVLNLSHSVAVILYELSGESHVGHIIPASKAEKEQIMKMLSKALDKMEFATKEKKETQIKVWKRMVGKSFLTKREAYALMGFFKKLK
ncbi:RNA methyltransferase [Candidatus Woesearchaeota archaeon]|nr:RNA methyltransferase [Candidatus Woesearchaeota archaeon]